MTILRVFDTLIEARKEAERTYRCYNNLGKKVKIVDPYSFMIRVEYGKDCYLYTSRNVPLRGILIDYLEDYTTLGLPSEVMMCVRPKKFEDEYEVRWE